MRVKIECDEKGKIVYGRADLEKAFRQLKGPYIVDFISLSDPHSIEEWRRLYFHLRDLVWQEAGTGYTREEFHKEIKKHCLLPMFEALHFFSLENPPSTLSTKLLNEAGWKEFVQRFKEFAQHNFEIYV